MASGLAPDELLDGVHNAFLDVTAQRLTDVQTLSGNLYRHCPRKTEWPFSTAIPGHMPLLAGADLRQGD
jgi:hypothetical protein